MAQSETLRIAPRDLRSMTADALEAVLRMLEANRLKDIHFMVEEEAYGSWPVHSWTIQVKR